MTRAFLFLFWHSTRNRLLSALRRLKRPKYLISFLVGATYFYFFAVRHWITGLRAAASPAAPVVPPALAEYGAALLIMIAVVVAWLGPTPDAPLAFTETEIQFLFPAPVPRRRLVLWKLMRGQIGVLVTVFIFTMVVARGLAAGHRTVFFAGAWLAFATMQLHLTGVRMARHRLSRRRVGWATRAAVTMGAAGLVLGASALWTWRHVGPPSSETFRRMEGPGGFVAYASRLFESGPALWFFYPARLLARPALAPGAGPFLLALVPAFGLLGLHYLWVIRAGVELQEGAIEAAQKAEARRLRARRGRAGHVKPIKATPPPFTLAPTGPAEVALLWKSLIHMTRGLGGLRAILLIVAGSIVSSLVFLKSTGGRSFIAPVVATMCAMIAFALLVLGPAVFRSDFRQELLHIDLLKSYPLAGRTIVGGTLLGPVACLTIIQWVLLAIFAVLAGDLPIEGLPWPGSPGLIALTVALMALPINLVSALVHNAAVLLVPGWVTLGAARTTGVERFGQVLIASFGRLVALGLSLLPAAVVFAASWFFASLFMGGAAAIPVSALPSATALSVEAWLGIQFLGAYVERFDPSSELDAVAR